MSKGDGRRPAVVEDGHLTHNWCATFGHKPVTPEGGYTRTVCYRCGRRRRVTEEGAIKWDE